MYWLRIVRDAVTVNMSLAKTQGVGGKICWKERSQNFSDDYNILAKKIKTVSSKFAVALVMIANH